MSRKIESRPARVMQKTNATPTKVANFPVTKLSR